MNTDDDLWRLLGQVERMPYGSAQIAAIEQLIRRADGYDDEHFGFAVRMFGTHAYVYGGEPAKGFVTFSRCLADFDREPRPYHERYLHQLLWHFKYMITALLKFPEVPLDRTYAVLDDMERRYRDSGHSPQAVYKYRHLVAAHIEAAEERDEWYRRWLTAPRDALSDCAGCDPSSQVSYLVEQGRHEEAIALAEPVLAGRLNCTEQPQNILTNLLLPYLRTGRLDAARDAHRQAYRRLRGNLADLWDIADHIRFCTWTGNDVRGMELVERHLSWLDQAPSPAAAMHFAGSAAATLRRLDEAGQSGLTVHRRAYGDRPAADVPVGELAAELTALATDLAARFDVRNGNDSQSRRLAERLGAEPIVDHLPLSASQRPGAPAARSGVGAPATGSGAGTQVDGRGPAVPDDGGAAGGRSEPAGHRDEPVEVPADASPEQLLQLAEQLWRTERPVGRDGVLRVYDERVGASAPSPRLMAWRAELRAAQRADANDLDGAQEANREALAGYRELPDPVREQIVAGRLGLLLCLADDAQQGLALVRAATEYLDVHGDARERAAGQDRLASALAQQGEWAEALAALDRVDLDAAGDPYLTVRVVVHRAHILGELGRAEEFEEAARHAVTVARTLGVGKYLAAACLAYAQTVEDPAEAVHLYDEALVVSSPDAVLPVRVGRARALTAADRPVDAIEDFVEAVALCTERGITEGAAYLRWELAGAYQSAGRLAEAAEVAEEAVTELDRLGHQADADRARHLLATIYLALDEDQPALALLDQLAGNLDGPDNLPSRAQVLEEAGGILYDRDRDALAAQRFAAAAEAYRLAGLAVDELRARRREAMALLWAGEPDAAVEAAERVDRVGGALPEAAREEPAVIWELAMADDAAARVLLGADRPEEALTRLSGVADRLRGVQAFGEALQVDALTGELLLRLDRPDEAEPVLRAVLGALPRQSGAVQRAAWWLAATLSRLGRAEEAAALRAEYGLADSDEDED